ncbi:MAG: NAD(+)/NADH kinase [Anaerobiospirillum sp.]|nr:NAD(+)/NADH kinase [Anaerobiospirillum sp.]
MAESNLPNKKIKRAVIVSKVYHRPLSGAISAVAKTLNRLGVEAFVDQNTAVGFNIEDVPIIARRSIRDTDIIIVIGGDGSLLSAARALVDFEVPMLGVNRGHLGLLTDVSPNTLDDALNKIVAGKYSTEERMMLDVRVYRRDEDGAEELVGQSLAMNETVVHSGILAHMIVCRVLINGRFMYSLRGDGIIVGTPTGSTAYSLSAGGPIIEPHLDLLSLVPMFPQSLNCSPIVIPGKSRVEIEFAVNDDVPEWVNVNCDGQATIRADTKCIVCVRQHHTPLTLIHPEGYDYYSVLRQKLGWGQSLV